MWAAIASARLTHGPQSNAPATIAMAVRGISDRTGIIHTRIRKYYVPGVRKAMPRHQRPGRPYGSGSIIRDSPRLQSEAVSYVDGASSFPPHVGFYDETGAWAVERTGVAPDITVIDDPALMWQG